jgi:hypothetical protein
MTARELIDDIFSRAQGGPGHLRRITIEQLKFLRNLIAEDPERALIVTGAPGSLIWRPSGDWKYVLTEDLVGKKHTLTKLHNLSASEQPRLF